MRKYVLIFGLFVAVIAASTSTAKEPPALPNRDVMSKEYWTLWNDEVQKKLDGRIEKYRKADAKVELSNVKPGSEIKIEQISHEFLFGGNIFLFGNFKTSEQNKQYEDTFGNLFNAATVPFYWKTLEPEQGKPRYAAGSPSVYRRPATDPVVAFCESKGINMNGHAIIYGKRIWGHPEWMPEDRKEMEKIFELHVRELADRYKNRLQRWDVVNESIDQANRGLMPDDYTFKTFSWAMRYFPETAQLGCNDCDIHWEVNRHRRYVEIVRDLIDRGIRVNNVGVQMHIFNPKESTNIAKGAKVLTSEQIEAVLECLDNTERPLQISEVTVSAPDVTETGSMIQAVITRNLYRCWFSYPSVMSITWWNVADGGAAPGEPATSGLFTQQMEPKPAYYALDRLINYEWKTNIVQKADAETVTIPFRGFKGKYKISWTDKTGNIQSKEIVVTNQ
ncbi:MAG: endo-1,4-beta-xylanase [Planctomycetaceae bacterium]|jgi:GH35 family endo-1,4-beta-xylanase|nr:endo-1,4-beta-xylanase [Planctomycetaceae bacterium]